MREQLGAALLALTLVACVAPDEIEQLEQNQRLLLKRMERLEKKLAQTRFIRPRALPPKGPLLEAFDPGRNCSGFKGYRISYVRGPLMTIDEDSINDRTFGRALEIIRDYPREWPPLEIRVYTDALGSSAYNLDLSKRRARAIKTAMVKLGADEARLVAKGYGETELRIEPSGCDLSSRTVFFAP